MELALRVTAGVHWDNRANLSRPLGIVVWYLVAVVPWRELAALGGLPLDDEPFTVWAGQDPGTREALEFLASTGTLAKLAVRSGHYERVPAIGPGCLLGAVAAAYSSRPLPGPLHPEITAVLVKLAGQHMLTRPMADLLPSLAPDALDGVFGEDVAAEGAGPAVRRAAARSSQALPVTALPDWEGWSGASVPAARVISASLVRAGLAEPEERSAAEYLTWVRDLWVPDLHWLSER
jgi:hypothetical protein